jgi:hypothetical protein
MSKHFFRLPQIAVMSVALVWTPLASSQPFPVTERNQQSSASSPHQRFAGPPQAREFSAQESPEIRQFREMVYSSRDSDCCFLDVRLLDGSTAHGSIAVANLVWFELFDPKTGQRTRVDYDRIQKLKSVPKHPALATTQPLVPRALLVIKNLIVFPLFPFWFWLFWDGC